MAVAMVVVEVEVEGEDRGIRFFVFVERWEERSSAEQWHWTVDGSRLEWQQRGGRGSSRGGGVGRAAWGICVVESNQVQSQKDAPKSLGQECTH